MCTVIGIDGSLEYKDELIKFFTDLKWTGNYKQAKLIPFKTNSDFTKHHMVAAIDSHSAYVDQLWTKTLQIDNFNQVIFKKHSALPTTLSAWLRDCTINGGNNHLFEAIETSKPNYVRLIYKSDNNSKVLSTVNNLHRHMSKLFDNTTATLVLGPAEEYEEKLSASTKHATYMSNLATDFIADPTSLPKASKPPPIRRKRPQQAWYGPNPIIEQTSTETVTPNPNVIEPDSNAAANTSSTNASLPTNFQQMISNEVQNSLNSFETRLSNLDTAVNSRITEVANNCSSAIAAVDRKTKRRAKRHKDALMLTLQAITAHLGVKAPETPEESDDDTSGDEE